MDRSFFPRVSDPAFQAVITDISAHPMSSMKATASRTGIGYLTVCKAVKYGVMEGSIVRRRIGQVKGGHGVTYANMINPNCI